MTPVEVVYDAFFTQVTDDLYMEITEEETKQDCYRLLLNSLPLYEFPGKVLRLTTDDEGHSFFTRDLDIEEINILALGMVQIWLGRQINTIELTRQKFTGHDFKQTSQAAHLSRLMSLLTATKDEHRRLQMLQSRRRINQNDEYESAFDLLVKRKH